jgi:5-methylcytosine-specific restriction enzyme B
MVTRSRMSCTSHGTMSETAVDVVPPFHTFLNPILTVFQGRNAPASNGELEEAVMAQMHLPPAITSIPHKADRPDRSEVSYRIAWARTYLKKAGLIDNPERGIWSLTPSGAKAGKIDERELVGRIVADSREGRVEMGDGDAFADASAQAHASLDSPALIPRLAEELRRLYDNLVASGEIEREPELVPKYRAFRERFGPDVLAGLDGQRLLQTLHARGTRDSLVYWLEFKDDAEFPARFGSIAGGSALKFGMYQSADTGDWWTGSANAQLKLSVDEAIAKARMQRDQLVAAAAVLDDIARRPDVDYLELQRRIVEVAPNVAETAWGHKYLSLLFPTILDDFHAVEYQQFQSVKLLKIPAVGRYANAHYIVGAARQLGIQVSNFGSVLNHRNGAPHSYWRVGTTIDGESDWPRMREANFVGIGWTELGDLSEVEPSRESKDKLRARFAEKWPGNAGVITRHTQEIFDFSARARERDVVVAMDGATVRGVGVINGPYFYKVADGPFAHRKPVRWLSVAEGPLPRIEQLRTTFRPLGKRWDNLVDVERRILEAAPGPAAATSESRSPAVASAPASRALEGIPGRIHAALQRKRQVILYGPPGTGKTYWADVSVREIAGRTWFGKTAATLTAEESATLVRDGAIQTCTFHASYGYEDFVEGYRPEHEGGLTFRRRDGIFKKLCTRALANPSRHYFLVIDEINRGDVPRILGDLLTVLEKDKRGKEIVLPVSGEVFSVPDNIYVIGTMNTADRSIALLDAALRRRFAFIELMPETAPLAGALVDGLPLGPWLEELNRRIVRHAGRDARCLQVGHAYLLPDGKPIRDAARFAEVLRDDIIPLLEEYCYENYEALADILGDKIVARGRRRIVESFFEKDRQHELIEALLKSFSTISATAGAVNAEAADAGDRDEEEDTADEVASTPE